MALNTLNLVTGFFKGLALRENEDSKVQDCRIAAIALMCHVIHADGNVDQQERKVFDQTIARYFDSEGTDIKDLLRKAKLAYRECDDVYQLAYLLHQDLTKDECKAFIAILWQLAYADGTIYEIEESAIERIAEILKVDNPSALKSPEKNALHFQRRMNN